MTDRYSFGRWYLLVLLALVFGFATAHPMPNATHPDENTRKIDTVVIAKEGRPYIGGLCITGQISRMELHSKIHNVLKPAIARGNIFDVVIAASNKSTPFFLNARQVKSAGGGGRRRMLILVVSIYTQGTFGRAWPMTSVAQSLTTIIQRH
jgi:hypothetical protein